MQYHWKIWGSEVGAMPEKVSVRNSVIAPYIDGLLNEKRVNGFKYETEELTLNRLDRYCTEKGLTSLEITKEFLADWLQQSETEGPAQLKKRVCTTRQLMIYMYCSGEKVYVPHNTVKRTQPIPHIFDDLENKAFFRELDAYQPKNHGHAEVRLHGEYRQLFRLYCCCGLRNTEACGIATEDVDLVNGILRILDAKGRKDRLVYMSDDLTESCRLYHSWLVNVLGYEPRWFFPACNPENPLSNDQIDAVFNRFWSKTKYASCNNKPTPHDFRFTFVVKRMNAWAEAGLDLKVMMPYLSRYLGHKSVSETYYYYFLVNDAYKTVNQKDRVADEVIPEVM